MLGKIIGAVAGKKLASQVGGLSGTGGALLGAAAPMVLRRLGPVGMIAAAAGGYALKRYLNKRDAAAPVRPSRTRAK